MTYTIAILYLCVARILLFSCRVVYKNPVQQAFSGLSLCLIKNEKWKNLKIQKNIIYSYLGRESNQKSII
jgi:hypothetical protein|nr:MAG TPA: hypothetical protein [Caudoviricetes sp.]DAP04277.1 MAG TPA: hypothetical protein [Caudoviricetes sp.]